METRRPEAIDTRMVFQVYAGLACIAGFVLIAWGPAWLGAVGNPVQTAWIRLAGAAHIAAAFFAGPLAFAEDPRVRRRGLFWFAAGYLAVSIVLAVERSDLGLPEAAIQLGWIPIALLYLGNTAHGEYKTAEWAGLFSRRTDTLLRSQYEQEIRQAAAQEERNRLARDLHDSIKQQLFVIQTAAATAQARAESDPAGAGKAVEQVRNSVREAMAEMEVITANLRSAPLENAGLIGALKRDSEALGFRTGAQVEFRLEGDLPRSEELPPGAHRALVMVAEEAFANIGRHARAQNVRVLLFAVPGRVELQIKDDGTGFDPNQGRRGIGIANMRARADEFNSEFELLSSPGAGTAVKFSLPYVPPEPAREYLRRTLIAGAWIFGFAAIGVWRREAFMLTMCALASIQLIRNIVAYRRVRNRSGATA